MSSKEQKRDLQAEFDRRARGEGDPPPVRIDSFESPVEMPSREYLPIAPVPPPQVSPQTQRAQDSAANEFQQSFDKRRAELAKGPPVDNCPLKFTCSKRWEELTKTENPRTRHCDSCDKTVHLCNSRNEYERYLAEGACVALGKRISTTRLLGSLSNSKLKSFLE